MLWIILFCKYRGNYVFCSCFCFFPQPKHLFCLIKPRLNHWSHMEYFNDVFPIVVDLESVNCVDPIGGTESSRISGSYGWGTTWGWVINYRIFIFGWTNPLTLMFTVHLCIRFTTSLKQYLNSITLDQLLISHILEPASHKEHSGLSEQPWEEWALLRSHALFQTCIIFLLCNTIDIFWRMLMLLFSIQWK